MHIYSCHEQPPWLYDAHTYMQSVKKVVLFDSLGAYMNVYTMPRSFDANDQIARVLASMAECFLQRGCLPVDITSKSHDAAFYMKPALSFALSFHCSQALLSDPSSVCLSVCVCGLWTWAPIRVPCLLSTITLRNFPPSQIGKAPQMPSTVSRSWRNQVTALKLLKFSHCFVAKNNFGADDLLRMQHVFKGPAIDRDVIIKVKPSIKLETPLH